MLGSYLKATGELFDVDAFLAKSDFAADVVYHKGDRTLRRRMAIQTNGFSVVVSRTFGEIAIQVRCAMRFFRRHEQELIRLRNFPGVGDVRLIFTFCPGSAANVCHYFPPDLLELAATAGAGIELSVYPNGTAHAVLTTSNRAGQAGRPKERS